ncbi:MAG: hypothetical protein WCO60_14690 [Verrucomicrobiota bacterium]
MNDDELHQLLRHTQLDEQLPSSFQRDVWQKIAADEERMETRWSWLDGLLGWFTKPLPAAAAWSVALFVGLVLGNLRSQPVSSELRFAGYAQLINPLAKISTR